jgi:hypothetical protein
MYDSNQKSIESEFDASYKLPVLYLPQLLGLAMGFDRKELGLNLNVVKTKELFSNYAPWSRPKSFFQITPLPPRQLPFSDHFLPRARTDDFGFKTRNQVAERPTSPFSARRTVSPPDIIKS